MQADEPQRSVHSKRLLLRRFLFIASSLLVVGLVASWVVGGRLIAPHPRAIGAPPPDLPATSIALASESGATIAGWHLRAEGGQGVIVLLHGMGGSRLWMLGRARFLHRAGYSVVLIDLQAHGNSSGEQITLGDLERHDVRAAIAFARQAHPDEPVGVVGQSLGGVAALLAAPLDIDALVLESVYPTIRSAVYNRVGAQLGFLSDIPAELLLAQLEPRLGVEMSQLRPIDRLPEVGCPVLLMGGTEDRHTTAEETEAMFAAAREPKALWLVEGAGHENLHRVSPEAYETRVLDFFATYLRREL